MPNDIPESLVTPDLIRGGASSAEPIEGSLAPDQVRGDEGNCTRPITYRGATPTDIPAIDAFFRQSFADTFGHLYAPADLATFFGQFTAEAWAEEFTRLRFRLAEREGRLVGYAKLGAVALPVTPVGQAAELWQLYLADEAKGLGIADALLGWAIDTARSDGAGELFLSVFIDNHRAKRFYARHGFVDIGPYAFKVGDHLDEDRLMRLVL